MRNSLEEEAVQSGISVEALAEEAIALLLLLRRTQAHFAKLRAEVDFSALDKFFKPRRRRSTHPRRRIA